MHLYRAILRTGTTLLEKKQIRHLRAFRIAIVKEGPDVKLFTHPAALTKLALWLGQAIAEQERDRKGGMMMGMARGGRGTPLVVAGLNERRGVYVVVGTGRGSGAAAMMPDPTRKTKMKKRKKEGAITKAAEKDRRHKEREARKAEQRQRPRERQVDDDNDDESNSSSTASTSSEDDDDDDANEDDNEEDEEIHRVRRRRGYGFNRFGHAFQEVVDETNARVRIDSFEHCVVEVRVDDLAAFLESLSLKVVVG